MERLVLNIKRHEVVKKQLGKVVVPVKHTREHSHPNISVAIQYRF